MLSFILCPGLHNFRSLPSSLHWSPGHSSYQRKENWEGKIRRWRLYYNSRNLHISQWTRNSGLFCVKLFGLCISFMSRVVSVSRTVHSPTSLKCVQLTVMLSFQGATSHHLGQNFSKMFDIVFEDPDPTKQVSSTMFTWNGIMVHRRIAGKPLPSPLPSRSPPPPPSPRFLTLCSGNTKSEAVIIITQ